MAIFTVPAGPPGPPGGPGPPGPPGPPGFAVVWTRVLRSAVQAIPNTTLTAIVWDAQSADEGNIFTPPSALVGPVGTFGLYSGAVNIDFAAGAGGSYRSARVISGNLGAGTILAEQAIGATGAPLGDTLSLRFDFEVPAVDSLVTFVEQDSGGPLNLTAIFTMIRHR